MWRLLSARCRWIGGASLFAVALSLSAWADVADPAVTRPNATRPTGLAVTVGVPKRVVGAEGVAPDFVDAIAIWLSPGGVLPPGYRPPRIVFASQRDMTMTRFSDVASETVSAGGAPGRAGSLAEPADLVAIYDDRNRVISLPSDWTGATPVEESILVHEMVHHLQNLAGARFSCPQGREQAAYAAQAEWLALFGHDLFADFDTDAMTLLVRTQCGF